MQFWLSFCAYKQSQVRRVSRKYKTLLSDLLHWYNCWSGILYLPGNDTRHVTDVIFPLWICKRGWVRELEYFALKIKAWKKFHSRRPFLVHKTQRGNVQNCGEIISKSPAELLCLYWPCRIQKLPENRNGKRYHQNKAKPIEAYNLKLYKTTKKTSMKTKNTQIDNKTYPKRITKGKELKTLGWI